MDLRTSARYVLNGVMHQGEERYRMIERVAARLHRDALLSERAKYWLLDEEFRSLYLRFDSTYQRRMDRVWTLAQFARMAARLDGSTAECGTYTGATSYFICREVKGTGKVHHVFDSFEGLSEPGPDDGSYWRKGDLSADEAEVRRNLSEFDFVEYHRGWIPDRFPEVASEKFCLVHVDVDLEAPTRDAVQFFHPRLVPGGIMVFDDYGFTTCPAARHAVEDFMTRAGEIILDLPTGQGVVIKSPASAEQPVS